MAACDSALDMDLHDSVVVGVNDVTWSCMYMHNDIHVNVNERCRKKEEASKVKQTSQSNTAHPRQSLFQRKMTASGGIRTHDTQTL